ncbi:hypothetical protein VTK73DRAFT_6228 [Phialemonium thermophilum]|uniref:Basic proline-rich protein n=1 Tax=Phialemonium thermophilum TaxID=223376 RepID=A0ABR3XXB6_9PEZI
MNQMSEGRPPPLASGTGYSTDQSLRSDDAFSGLQDSRSRLIDRGPRGPTATMEPVPETERMEEFQPSPLPGRLHSSNSFLADFDGSRKPPTLRRSTDPAPSSPGSAWVLPAALPYRPRTASPLSGSHTRSRSTASLLTPPMARTQSLPGVNGAGHILCSPPYRPQSPFGSPSRIRIPKKLVDEPFPTSPTRLSVLDHERNRPEGATSSIPPASQPSTAPAHRTKRPSSPLRQVQPSTGSNLVTPGTPSSIASSPSYRSYDYLAAGYALAATYPSSSVPSTPTSTRSRSPSISSLETIPDSPDAEEAALEAERIAQLKAAAEAAEGGETKGKGGLDIPARGRTLAFGSRDKRKRWSVCGAERRGDLDLETIWED